MQKTLAALFSLGPLVILVPLALHNHSNAQHGPRVTVGEGVAQSLSSNLDVMIHGCDDFTSNDIGSSKK